MLGYFLVLRKAKEAEYVYLSLVSVLRLTSVSCRLPFTLVQRMTFNQSVGLGIGLVPLIGDLMLAVWKANSRKYVAFRPSFRRSSD